jgi:hypothetical protein
MAAAMFALLELQPSEAFVVSAPVVSTCTTTLIGSCHTTSARAMEFCVVKPQRSNTVLYAAAAAGNEKRKRRRKKPPAAPAQDPVKVSQEIVEGIPDNSFDDDDEEALIKQDLAAISEIARFEFQTDKEITMGVVPDIINNMATTSSSSTSRSESSSSISGNAILLPDIKEARKKKQMEEEMARVEQEKEEQKVRIKRSDKEAFRRVSYNTPGSADQDS